MEKEFDRVTEDEELELEEAEAEETGEAEAEDTGETAEDTSAELDDEELAPEDRARRLFASYMEPVEKKEPKPAPKVEEPEDAISLSDLLGDVDLDDDDEEVADDDEEGEVREEGRNWFVVHSYSGYELSLIHI